MRVGTEILFIQRAGRKLFAVAYDPDSYVAYSANDLSVLSEHITESGIVEMAYQQQPDSIAWLIRTDGTMCSMVLDRAQDVIAWSRHVTEGAFESVSSIPTDSGDAVYTIVKREINGETLRYVELLVDDLRSDAAVTGTREPVQKSGAG